MLLTRAARSQLSSPTAQAAAFNRGTTRLTYTRFAAISTPAIANVQFLCRESVTSHGIVASAEATVAPSPSNTSSDGNAQHSSVPTDENSERYCSQNAGRALHYETVFLDRPQ